MAIDRERVVFIRVGWMKYYGHIEDGTIPVGGGSHNEAQAGAEGDNFYFDDDGAGLGYVYINSKDGGFNLWRIAGAEADEVDSLDDVLVVSVARDPVNGGQVVVGWHDKAICHRLYSDDPRAYNFTTRAEHCVLLPPEERTCQIPRGRGGMGQFNVCYTRQSDGSTKGFQWIEDALDFVAGYSGPNLLEGDVQEAQMAEEPAESREDSFDGRGFPLSMVAASEPETPTQASLRDTKEWFSDHASFSLLSLDEIATAVNAKPQRIRLPSFQRDAAWDWADIELLWDSVLRGYPLGSLLFARARPDQMIALRELRKHREAAAKATEGAGDEGALILLDGQQRASAIAIGLRPWKPGHEARLWLDLSLPKRDRYGFRLCSVTLPWGPEVTSAQKRRAQERLSETLTKDSGALGLTWPARASVPVPFAELVALTREGRFAEWRELVPMSLRAQTDLISTELEAEWQKVLQGIAAFRVPAILMVGIPTAGDLAKTFERLNTAGRDMGQEELFFSGIKLKWPQAHDLVWDIYSDMETGRFLAPTKIVHLAVRLAATRNPGSDRDIIPMDLRAFRNNLETEGGDELLREIASYLEPREDRELGRLREVLREARAALSYSPGSAVDDPGYPAPLLAAFSFHLWHVLSAWIDRRHDVDRESRAEMLRFAAAMHFFIKSPTPSLSRRLFLASRNAEGRFPGRALWKILVERGGSSDILTPGQFEEELRDEAGVQRYAVLFNERDLVIWIQRAFVQRWFSDYDPTLYTGRAAEKPYDMDHILPKGHFDQRSSRNIEPAEGFYDIRSRALHSSGNFRMWPRSENRRDQDGPLTDKGLLGRARKSLPKDSYLRLEPLSLKTVGDVRRASFLPEEDLHLWRKASPKEGNQYDWSSKTRLRAFDRAVFSRRVRMYRAFFEALGFEAWLG